MAAKTEEKRYDCSRAALRRGAPDGYRNGLLDPHHRRDERDHLVSAPGCRCALGWDSR